MASVSGSAGQRQPTCIIVLGMAGSGKSTFVKKLVEYLSSTETGQPYTVNLDPAVYHTPYHANIDIRDTVKFKEVMKQYGFGPNGAIMTSLNFFAARFDQVLNLINKNACRYGYVVFDTPGQIEVFTWSASGMIITGALAASYPTLVIYIVDTPRSHNPVTFMSNMLYACSVLYRMQLPFICVFNKTDVIDCDFAIEWMRNFEAFQRALDAQRSATLDGVDWVDGPFVDSDSSQYMTSLTNSMALVLDEFYNDLKSCGVSSFSGDGMPRFLELVKDATAEYYNEYLPALQAKKVSRKCHRSLLSRKCGNMGDGKGSVVDEDDDEDEDGLDDEGGTFRVKPMLVDLVGRDDNAHSDPLVHLDGVEQKPDDDDQMDGMVTHLSELERAMLKRLAEQEGPHFRHQTRDEVSLSVEEKVNLAGDLLRRNPGEFLARYYRFLCWPEDAECFRELWDNYTVRYYLKEVVGVSSPSSTSADAGAAKVDCETLRRRRKMRVKNRRLVALRRMEAEAKADPTEGFFSDEQMRERAPELWEHMVGRYLSDTDRRALLGHQYESFSGMLLSQLLDTEQKPNRQADNLEEDTDDSEADAEFNPDRLKSQKPTVVAEQERSRQEFREMMHSHFLAGLDEEFNYDAIDNDSALDDEMEELVHDAEDIYFDSESPSAAPPYDYSDLEHNTDSTGDCTLTY